MFPLRESLSLSRTWSDENEVVLVSWFEWQRVHAESGYHEIDSHRALWMLDSLDCHRLMEARSFVSDLRLNSFPLDRTRDHEVLELIRQALNNRRLVAVQKGAEQPAIPSVTVQLRRLVAQVEKATHGKLFHQGRQYKLVVDVELASTPGRDYYEVASQSEARAVLDSLAKISPASADLLKQASDKLTKDWYPPSQPDGLILLRRILTPQAATSNNEPAITPSQLRALMEKATLEIHMVDLNKKPQEGVAFKIDMPDGGSVSGKLDKEGHGRAKSSSAGVFTVTFPDLDGADWDGDGALDLPPDEERSKASTYKVEQGDRLPSIGRDKGFLRWQTIWNFKGNADLRKLRGTAHILLPGDEVSIPSKLSREAEVPGGTAEYVVQTAAEVLRVRFAGVTSTEAHPVTYKATPDTGGAIEGILPDNRKLEIDLPPDTTKVHVELSRKEDGADAQGGDGDASGEEKPFISYDFTVGGLDPASEVSGVQARLLNLGFYTGGITGNLDDDTRAAISHFRWAKLRDRKEDMDEGFLAALNKTHES